MTVLTAKKPFTSDDPVLLVENQLPIGAHLIRLVVVDDEGLQSDPFDATITVVEGRSTNPILGGITVPPGRIVEAVQPIVPLSPERSKTATTKPATTRSIVKPATPKPKPTKDGDKP